MKRTFVFAAACIAAIAFSLQTANAGTLRHGDKRVAVVALGMGAASTAAYFGINKWKWSGWDNGSGLSRAGAWGITTIGCAAISPIVATVVLKRELTSREAGVLLGSCVVPIIGGWLVNEAYEAHPEWEQGAKPVRHWKKRAHK